MISSTTTTQALNQIRGLLFNRWGVSCFSLLLVQQFIEASATYWLVTMMRKVTTGQDFFPFLYLYLASLIIPYIPGCFASIIKISWKQIAQRYFIESFIASNKEQVGEWGNKSIKEEKLSILASEGPSALYLFIDYVYDLAGYLISVCFNVFALSIILEPLFGVAYLFSVTTVLIIMKVQQRKQRFYTLKALTARLDLYQSLLASWDNVLLGNEYNFKIWENKTKQRLDNCLEKNVQLERFDQILAIVICLLTSIPSLIVAIYYVVIHQSDIAALSSFLVTLPILFLIVSYTYQTLSLAFRWNMHRSKLVAIYKAIQPIKYPENYMEKKVKWPKIVFSTPNKSATSPLGESAPQHISSHLDIIQHALQAGRITLRGENGSGKSTLLMLIKNSLMKRTFFLPTQNQLSFLSETNKHSTGECLKNRLLEILEMVEADVLLLDEWDANLDPENKERLSLLIDEIAEKKCVIEVRHR
jgi:ABC-type transport system involved in cytochrome bd biosynthesis fused ATPase/permease subunit